MSQSDQGFFVWVLSGLLAGVLRKLGSEICSWTLLLLSKAAVSVAAALLPPALRARYREEWKGLASDMPTGSLRQLGVCLGLLVAAVRFRIDR